MMLATRCRSIWRRTASTCGRWTTAPTSFPPDTPAEKLAVMAGWTSRVFDGDVEAAAAFVSARTHAEKVFIAGFSRGASFAYLFAAMHPQRVAGLAILDGFIPRRLPRERCLRGASPTILADASLPMRSAAR